MSYGRNFKDPMQNKKQYEPQQKLRVDSYDEATHTWKPVGTYGNDIAAYACIANCAKSPHGKWRIVDVNASIQLGRPDVVTVITR